MKENEDVVKALHDAIGSKADLNEMESLLGMKLDKTGDAKDVTVSYESSDTTAASSYTEVPVLTGKEKFKEFCSKVSTMFKNIRYLRRLLGTTDISKLGDGTVTGALSALNTGLAGKAPSSHRHSWENITDKPSTFPPINHSHSYLPITGGNISGNLIVDGNIQGGSWLMSTNCLGTKNSFAIMSNDKNRITLIWTGTQLDLYVDSHRMGKFSIN